MKSGKLREKGFGFCEKRKAAGKGTWILRKAESCGKRDLNFVKSGKLREKGLEICEKQKAAGKGTWIL